MPARSTASSGLGQLLALSFHPVHGQVFVGRCWPGTGYFPGSGGERIRAAGSPQMFPGRACVRAWATRAHLLRTQCGSAYSAGLWPDLADSGPEQAASLVHFWRRNGKILVEHWRGTAYAIFDLHKHCRPSWVAMHLKAHEACLSSRNGTKILLGPGMAHGRPHALARP